MNYQDEPDGTLRQISPGTFICATCGLPAADFAITKVSAVDLTPHDWACDGCRSTWMRELRPINGRQKPRHKLEWLHDFMLELGAPGQEIARLRSMANDAVARAEQKRNRGG